MYNVPDKLKLREEICHLNDNHWKHGLFIKIKGKEQNVHECLKWNMRLQQNPAFAITGYEVTLFYAESSPCTERIYCSNYLWSMGCAT